MTDDNLPDVDMHTVASWQGPRFKRMRSQVQVTRDQFVSNSTLIIAFKKKFLLVGGAWVWLNHSCF